MKTEIHEFPIGIYPRKLWVVVGTDNKFLTEYFGEKIDCFPENTNAITMGVQKQKPIKKGGILVWFQNRKSMSVDIIAHEAVHFAIDVFDYTDCRIDVSNQEPFAYLVGWAVKMMDKVRRNNFEEETNEE